MEIDSGIHISEHIRFCRKHMTIMNSQCGIHCKQKTIMISHLEFFSCEIDSTQKTRDVNAKFISHKKLKM